MAGHHEVGKLLLRHEPEVRIPEAWVGSQFVWFRDLAPGAKGRIGVDVVREWMTANGSVCGPARGSDADLVVDGIAVEVKLSTMWENGEFRFQQLRDQAWHILFCIGVCPERVRMWVLDKQTALAHAVGQHTGGGASETRWLYWPAGAAPVWTGSPEGDPDIAAERCRALAVARGEGVEPSSSGSKVRRPTS